MARFVSLSMEMLSFRSLGKVETMQSIPRRKIENSNSCLNVFLTFSYHFLVKRITTTATTTVNHIPSIIILGKLRDDLTF